MKIKIQTMPLSHLILELLIHVQGKMLLEERLALGGKRWIACTVGLLLASFDAQGLFNTLHAISDVRDSGIDRVLSKGSADRGSTSSTGYNRSGDVAQAGTLSTILV